jgi:hypothetical protein
MCDGSDEFLTNSRIRCPQFFPPLLANTRRRIQFWYTLGFVLRNILGRGMTWERAHSIVLAVLSGAAAAFGTMVLVSAVWAHDQHHPELSAWFKSLANSHGTPCCDGSDATRIEDVDWQTVCEADTGECHYQVRLGGRWWDVPPTAVVESGNRVGPALVWPVYYGDHDKLLIRCFLPGAGT